MGTGMTKDELRQRLIDLYNTYRTAALNRRYYGAKLTHYRAWNLAFEIALAVGTSAAIGSWAIWRGESGQNIWAVMAALSTIIAVLKPILNLSKNIERYSKLFIGHGDACYDLERIVREVSASQTFDSDSLKRYRQILERHRKLAADDDPRPSKRLLKRCFDEVNLQIPPTSLWLPG